MGARDRPGPLWQGAGVKHRATAESVEHVPGGHGGGRRNPRRSRLIRLNPLPSSTGHAGFTPSGRDRRKSEPATSPDRRSLRNSDEYRVAFEVARVDPPDLRATMCGRRRNPLDGPAYRSLTTVTAGPCGLRTPSRWGRSEPLSDFRAAPEAHRTRPSPPVPRRWGAAALFATVSRNRLTSRPARRWAAAACSAVC